MENKDKVLSSAQEDGLLKILEDRFKICEERHKGLNWSEIREKLINNKNILWSLHEMEITGGEPDVVVFDAQVGEYVFCDCSIQSPIGRRNICYDRDALNARKTNKPKNSALDMAAEMGIDILTEVQYRDLQKLGQFDTKTSSWVKTPDRIRDLGGAIFCERRYDTVFVFHNGASSYYSSRGFRGLIKV